MGGSRTEISSKINIEPEKWDEKKCKIKGTGPIDIRFNKILQELLLSIHQAIDLLKYNKFPVNATNIKLAISDKLFQTVQLIGCYESYIMVLRKRIGIDYTEASFEINKTTFDHVKEFLI